jgi:hypothetical protein
MSIKLHSTILATSLAAILGVGLAGVAVVADHQQAAAPKADRLVVAAAAQPASDYVTVETRHDGVSDLERIPIN